MYQAQTGPAVAEEIDGILEEFGVREKVVAATVDDAANMSVAVKFLHLMKLPCFAHVKPRSSETVQLYYYIQLDSFCGCVDEEIPHG